MKVVLLAPLLPIKPTTLPASMPTSSPAAAVTAPKRLTSPCACRIAAISRAPASHEQRAETFGKEHDHEQQSDAEHHLPRVGRVLVGDALDPLECERRRHRRRDARPAREHGDKDELARGG